VRRSVAFLLGCVLIPTIALAERFELSPVDPAEPLHGSATFVGRGPDAPAEIEGELGSMTGSRSLRVTLHEVERSRRLLVESIFHGRAGSARVEWRADVWEHQVAERLPKVVPFTPTSFRWLDATSFEFVGDGPWLDTDAGVLNHEARRTRFTLVEPGVFTVETGVEARTRYAFGAGPSPKGHAERRVTVGDSTFRATLRGMNSYPRSAVIPDPSTSVILLNGPNPYAVSSTLLVVLDECDLRVELLDGLKNGLASRTLASVAPGPYHLIIDQTGVGAGRFWVRLWEGDRFIGDTPYQVSSR
jgi:hypothetical protein